MARKKLIRRGLYCLILLNTVRSIIANAKTCIYYHNKYAGKDFVFNSFNYYDNLPVEYIICVRDDYFTSIIARSIGGILGAAILLLIVFSISYLLDKIFNKNHKEKKNEV